MNKKVGNNFLCLDLISCGYKTCVPVRCSDAHQLVDVMFLTAQVLHVIIK